MAIEVAGTCYWSCSDALLGTESIAAETWESSFLPHAEVQEQTVPGSPGGSVAPGP
jgi:hypothetical protein